MIETLLGGAGVALFLFAEPIAHSFAQRFNVVRNKDRLRVALVVVFYLAAAALIARSRLFDNL